MSSPQWYKERAREQLRREITWVIENKLRDPRLPSLVTISDIGLAADMRNATICASVYGDDKQKKDAIAALNGAAGFIQNAVAQRLSFKHFPKFCFKLDNSLDHHERINELLDQIKDDLA